MLTTMNSRFTPNPVYTEVVFKDSLDFVNDFADCPICRVMKKGHFLEMLRSGLNTFVKCIRWPDVMEGFGFSFPIENEEDRSKVASIEHWKNDVYGQCWSFNRPSQYMMEEYVESPVIVMSTVGNVYDDFYRCVQRNNIEFATKTRRMIYCVPEEMPRTWQSLSQMKTSTPNELMQNVLEYFLRKQLRYIHENEMRILIDETALKTIPQWKEIGIWKYNIDVAQLVQQVVLPSNMRKEEVDEIREAMIAAGIGYRIVISNALKLPM